MKKPLLFIITTAILITSHSSFAFNSDKFVMGYWSDWNIYSASHAISEPAYGLPGSYDEQGNIVKNADLQAKLDKINAISYSFLQVQENGSIYFNDPNSDLRLSANPDDITTKFCQQNNAICNYAQAAETWGRGNFNLGFVKLNNTDNHLRKLISIGGYGHDSSFQNAFNNPTTFVNSIIALVKTYNLDGVDLDYETTNMTYDAATQYANLIKQLRDGLNSIGPNKLITIAILANPDWIHNFGEDNWQNVVGNVDYIDLMTYDFHGAFDRPQITGYLTNLFLDPNDPHSQKFSVNTAVEALKAQNVPNEKIVIGVPAYGRVLEGVPSENHGLFQSFDAVPHGDLDPAGNGCSTLPTDANVCSGSFQYNYIIGNMIGKGFTDYITFGGANATSASGVWAYNPNWVDTVDHTTSPTFISYENVQSAQAKAQYVKENNLGGIMMWELRGDIATNDPASLLVAINNGLLA